ncbi:MULTISPECIES: hypothetical protein [unclassified Bradyrhizobium]|uniref:hypothetical protein n=1 Tax=unclassified Bradyrhizobium TaxID=2631580 RepID=UPI002304183C|nr:MULTISPECIES: hypothetical protein [unclassified Bradyrhizobium]MDA9398699.1 hypothetical protein [Bradyrhizobium sp. CCBAU 45389]MDA9528450.1 hypothetical protein [Bradyrhizobium sp. CCBAU 25338]
MSFGKLSIIVVASTFVASSAFGQQKPAVEQPSLTTEFVEKSIPACVDWTNLGTTNPKLLNSCGASHTIGVSNYSAGRHILDRVFHLEHGEERPVAFPGDFMAIDWVKGWTPDGADDGARYLTLYHYDAGGGVDLWTVRNNSPDRYNAYQYAVYKNGKRYGTSFGVAKPGETDRLFAFVPGETGQLILEWSRLDPN